jgi:predicted HTH transcriptional regulator
MSIEPHNCRTVNIKAVMPPKPDKPKGTPIPEAMLAALMAKDAKAIRARAFKTYGAFTCRGSGEHYNDLRKAEADAARDDLAKRALALITETEMTSGQIREHFGVSENQMRNALGLLRSTGQANFSRKGRFTTWHRVQEAAE